MGNLRTVYYQSLHLRGNIDEANERYKSYMMRGEGISQ